jgi:mRNA interferase MazF
MTTYQRGEILLVRFPYVSGTKQSLRPALVVLDTGDSDVLLARITTQIHRTPHDIAIADWKGAGLLVASNVRLHKLATLEKRLVDRQLGHLQATDQQNIGAVLRSLFAGW